MKAVIYYVFMNDEKWKEIVVEDFRFIITSGLFRNSDRIYIPFFIGKATNSSSGEEWIKFFWGRIDDEKKVEIYVENNEKPNIEQWTKIHPDEEIIYFGTNYS